MTMPTLFYVKDSICFADYSKYKAIQQFRAHLLQGTFRTIKVHVEYQFYGKQLTGGPSYLFKQWGNVAFPISSLCYENSKPFLYQFELQLLACDRL